MLHGCIDVDVCGYDVILHIEGESSLKERSNNHLQLVTDLYTVRT